MFVAVCMCGYATCHAQFRNGWWLAAVAIVWLCGALA